MTEQWRTKIEREARRVKQDTLYSYKGHFNAASLWRRTHYGLGIVATISSVLGGSYIVQASNRELWIWSAVASSALLGVLTFLNTQRNELSHHDAGVSFKSLHDEIRAFLNLELEDLPREEALSRFHEFRERRDQLNATSRPIHKIAYLWAKRGIEKGEADYEADEIAESPSENPGGE